MVSRRGLNFGIGINDADYVTAPHVNGKRVFCPYYKRWKLMLLRCYYTKKHKDSPKYADCLVCKDWLVFSNFKAWMESHDWNGKDLDKDIIIPGNRIYCPEACAFVDHATNSFLTDSGAVRGDYPIGVTFNEDNGKFRARCCNPFTKKREHLGYFSDENKAHLAWRERKHQLSCQLADLQTDERVAEALRIRFK